MLVCKDGHAVHLNRAVFTGPDKSPFVAVCSQWIVVTDELVTNKQMQLPSLCTVQCCSPYLDCCPAAIDPGMKGLRQDVHMASPWQALSTLALELAAERFPYTVLPRQQPPPVCTQPINYLPSSRTHIDQLFNCMKHSAEGALFQKSTNNNWGSGQKSKNVYKTRRKARLMLTSQPALCMEACPHHSWMVSE